MASEACRDETGQLEFRVEAYGLSARYIVDGVDHEGMDLQRIIDGDLSHKEKWRWSEIARALYNGDALFKQYGTELGVQVQPDGVEAVDGEFQVTDQVEDLTECSGDE